MFRILFILIAGLFTVYVAGCGDDAVEVEVEEDVGENYVYAIPPIGSTIAPNDSIFLVFESMPTDVKSDLGNVRAITSSIGVVQIDDISAPKIQITGPFELGSLDLTVSWSGGSQKLDYVVVDVRIPEGMVLIPAGEFQMGSEDAEAQANEQPVRTVYVDAFYMDATEITNGEYQRFVLENPNWQKEALGLRFHNGFYLKNWDGNNYPRGEGDHPVTYVNWYAAVAYARWVGKRLPTEAEWERAARGGLVGNMYPHGNTLTPADANYRDDPKGEWRLRTPVGMYPPNAYGLYDMAGNVWEWCLDEYDAEFYVSLPSYRTAVNPFSEENSVSWVVDNFEEVRAVHVWRGGSWLNPASLARVSYRGWIGGSLPITGGFSGFRCVKDLPR